MSVAKVVTSTNEQVFPIKKWLGVNESADGDTKLKMGEASSMSNFRITDDNSLQIRPGTANVAGLLSAYTITTAGTTTTVKTDLNTPSTFTTYPTVGVSAGGVLSLSGTAVSVTSANITDYTAYYWQNLTGLMYQVGTCTYTRPSTGTLVTGGSVSISSSDVDFVAAAGFSGDDYPNITSLTLYPSVSVSNGSVILSGSSSVYQYTDSGAIEKYYSYGGVIYQISLISLDVVGRPHWRGYPVSFVGNDTYTWNFYAVTATTASTDTEVRGIWSGYVDSTEYLVAACNGFLWSLTVSGGVWTKIAIGTITTTGNVHLFSFDDKLYILDGADYKVWNGTALSSVSGYAPIIATAAPYTGGGTTLEQANKLTGSKRIQFSPDGTHNTFQLTETGIGSVDFVKLNGTALTVSTQYTANLTTGVVTVTSTPSAGTNTLEIKWTKGTGTRSEVVAMKYSELYNGTTDNRVCLYGDGSNEIFYSGLDENGSATAEYFPDLNEIAVGDATPVTGLIRHYNRLLAFKEDANYTIYYDILTLDTGATTAGFYVSPINRAIGNCAPGQVQLVENYPRTLDGRSVYEWKNSSGNITNDQRNAKRISQRIEQTLSAFDLTKAVTYFDKINHEYYIIENSTALVHNTENDTWYIYNDFPAVCMINYLDELYIGTADGYIRHVSHLYRHDAGTAITATWESGEMNFGLNYRRKNSAIFWIGLMPELDSAINVTVRAGKDSSYAIVPITPGYTNAATDETKITPVKIKAKKFSFYKLLFSSASATTTATVTSADIKVRYTGNVR